MGSYGAFGHRAGIINNPCACRPDGYGGVPGAYVSNPNVYDHRDLGRMYYGDLVGTPHRTATYGNIGEFFKKLGGSIKEGWKNLDAENKKKFTSDLFNTLSSPFTSKKKKAEARAALAEIKEAENGQTASSAGMPSAGGFGYKVSPARHPLPLAPKAPKAPTPYKAAPAPAGSTSPVLPILAAAAAALMFL